MKKIKNPSQKLLKDEETSNLSQIELHSDEKVEEYFRNKKEGESSDDRDSPSFLV